MVLQLGNVKDDRRTINKNFEISKAVNAIIKEDSSIINPTFIIKYDGDFDFNYCFVSAYGRYYYITDITVMTGDRVFITCHVDVLMSHAVDILKLDCIINKQESKSTTKSNVYYDDGSYVVDSRTRNSIINFSSGLPDSGQFILICAG